MATISKVWAAVQEIYKTNLYGGADADIDGTEKFSSNVDLETDGYEGVHCDLKYDSSGTTDNMIVNIYGSLDGTNFDSLALSTFIADKNGGVETRISFIVKDLAQLRIGMKRDGSTDTFDVLLSVQRWRWQSA